MTIRPRLSTLICIITAGFAFDFEPAESFGQSAKRGAVTNRRGPSRSAPPSARSTPSPRTPAPSRNPSPSRNTPRNGPGRNVTAPIRTPSRVYTPNRTSPQTQTPRMQAAPAQPRPSTVFQPQRFSSQNQVGQSGISVPGFVRPLTGFGTKPQGSSEGSTTPRMGGIGRPIDSPRRQNAGGTPRQLSFNELDPNSSRNSSNIGRGYTSPIPRVDSFSPSRLFNPLPRSSGFEQRRNEANNRWYGGGRRYGSWCRPVYYDYIRPCYPRHNVYYNYPYWNSGLWAGAWLSSPIVYENNYYESSYPYNYSTQPTVVEVPYPVYVETPTTTTGEPTSAYAAPVESDQTGAAEYGSEFNGPHAPQAAPGNDSAESRMRPFLDAGFRAMEMKLYSQAQRNFLLATFGDERDGVALMLYAIASFARGDYDLASSGLRQALEITPELIAEPFDVRGLYSDDEELARHISSLVAAMDSSEFGNDLHLLLGYLYYSTGDPDNGAMTLAKGITITPSDSLLSSVRAAALAVE